MVFFFCKQKTAYELRISDWSSDVCSSDLVQTGKDQVGGLVDRVVVAVPEGQPGGREAAGAITDEVDDGGELGGHGDPGVRRLAGHYKACRPAHPVYWADDFQRKIGRASCRERVCQYV